MRRYTVSDGILLVNAARDAVSGFLSNGRLPDAEAPEGMRDKSGVFVTLNDRSGLRGCIGYPLPDMELFAALREAAVSAALRDTRFAPVRTEELDYITFEVTILTPPERITVNSPAEYPNEIVLGRDGLIVRNGRHSGLLLPQVPVEHGWNKREFLGYACEKAGLEKEIWREPDTIVERFQGIIFKEESPRGNVVEEIP